MDEEQRNKTHKNKSVGNKAAKREEFRKKRAGIELEPNRGSNNRAFQGPSAQSHKAQKFLRSVEKRETVLHVPTADKTLRHIVGEPPLLVAVVGPPGAGKTTLIRSMVKFYSNRNLQSVRGPITVVAGRSRRITFIECPNTLTAMCDVAKVADLVLLMTDGSFGYEMETFEFLNIAQVHGFPKMFGVVSHLDQLKTGKALKRRKKFLRHRFWHEVVAGAKLLCLSPMVRGMYRPTDVLKLHRLLICVEPKIQQWRNTHSCVLIDRVEDITSHDTVAKEPNCNRTVAFYGYARGKPMKPGNIMHIPGLGDFPISHLSHQDDPCTANHSGDGKSQGHRMRHLSMKQKKLYAPYCDVGGITYDDDAIYVQEDAELGAIERSGDGLRLLRELRSTEPMDATKAHLTVLRRPVVFRNEDTMELEMDAVQMPSDSDKDDEDADLYSDEGQRRGPESRSLKEFGLPDGSVDDLGDLEDDMVDTHTTLAPRLRNAPDSIRINTPANDWEDSALLRLLKNLCVTGDWKAGDANADGDDADEGDDIHSKGYDSNDEDFEAEARGEKPVTRCGGEGDRDGAGDITYDAEETNELTETFLQGSRPTSSTRGKVNALAEVGYSTSSSAHHRHTTQRGVGDLEWGAFGGERRPHGPATGSDEDDYDILAEEDEEDRVKDELDSDLEGLVANFLGRKSHTVQPHDGEVSRDDEGIQFYDAKAHTTRRGAATDEREEALISNAVTAGSPLTAEQEHIIQKKMAKKRAFDEEYDAGGKNATYSHYNHMQHVVEEKKERLDTALSDIGEDIEKKIQLVGYFSGLYVRFVLENIPVEFLRLFSPATPLIAGGINAGEDQLQIVYAKLKRHRWYPKILKAQDPVLLSMGWRRFQTQPIFATEDPNGRSRYLKYTPLHMHCIAAFYAPVVPTNTGFLAIPVREQKSANFRISCTGYTVGNDVATSVVKKLKLTGTPAKVQKTTAFIRGMFNSDIEAAKFVGAKVKCVSGIRGIIKAVLKGKQGLVRASFEDKILPSDIVFIRVWKPVDPPRYCSIQRNLVDPEWVGMRTMRELRWDHGVPIPANADSEYREIKRRQRDADEDVDSKGLKVLLSRNMRMQLPYDMKEEYIPLTPSNDLRDRLLGAVTVAPEVREQRRQALLDTFEDRADSMTQKREQAKRRARERAAKEASKEQEEYLRGLKKAKKETARSREFRSQHKSRH